VRYRTFVILYLADKFRGERSINGLYHLLKGKKSSQTIQDAKLYGVSFLFQTMSHLTQTNIQTEINTFVHNHWVENGSDEHVFLSDEGKNALKKGHGTFRFPPYLDGWAYGDQTVILWRRLSLYIQSLSNMLAGQQRFLPIIREPEVMQWVKRHFPYRDGEMIEKAEALYDEISSFLDELPERDASVFMLRLSGASRTGLTFQQIGERLGGDDDEIRMMFQGVLHRLFRVLNCNADTYRLLYTFIEDVNPLSLTMTTRKTHRFIQEGKSIEEITRRRGLKQGTIEDHLVELALHAPEFSIDAYVRPKRQQAIAAAVRETGSKKLKTIKEQLADDTGYFEIRLVMAKLGDV
jgi:uncharacterized protein YpbB